MMATDTVHGAARLTGIAPQFLVDDLNRGMAYYREVHPLLQRAVSSGGT